MTKQIKILRYDNNPRFLDKCWQKSIISICDPPCFNDDLYYILSELPQIKLKYWLFGFTKKQFIKANKNFKQSLKFCIDKSIAKWSNKSKLISYEINEKNLFIFDDQVLFDIRCAKQLNNEKGKN